MGKILCATRGGEASYRTQDAAIALAKERDEPLLFIYVIDLEFLNRTTASLVVDLEQELAKMGRFLLLIAQERAEDQAVKAETMYRKGKIREELKKVAIEEDVSLILLGRPGEDEESVFGKLDALRSFADELEEETGIEVRIV